MSVKQGGKMLIIDEQCMNEQRPRCEYVNVCVLSDQTIGTIKEKNEEERGSIWKWLKRF